MPEKKTNSMHWSIGESQILWKAQKVWSFQFSLSGGVSPLVSGDRVKKPFNLRNKALLLHHLPPISCLSFSYFTFTFISITFTLLSFHPLPYYIHINTLTPDFFPSSHFLLYTYSSLLSLLQFPSAF